VASLPEALPDADGGVPGASADGAGAETAAGVVVVDLASFQSQLPPGAPEHEALRLHHKALRAWRGMAAKAAWLLGGGRGGSGGGSGGGPRLVPVAVQASFATTAQIARHRTTAKLLLRAAKVLLALTRIGHDAAPLASQLVELAAGAHCAPGEPSLVDLLSPGDARRLLGLVAAAIEEAPMPLAAAAAEAV
jgi:hypothetical protein